MSKYFKVTTVVLGVTLMSHPADAQTTNDLQWDPVAAASQHSAKATRSAFLVIPLFPMPCRDRRFGRLVVRQHWHPRRRHCWIMSDAVSGCGQKWPQNVLNRGGLKRFSTVLFSQPEMHATLV